MDMFLVEVTNMETEQFGDAINIVNLGKKISSAYLCQFLYFFETIFIFRFNILADVWHEHVVLHAAQTRNMSM